MATEDVDPVPMTREEAKRILRRLELDAYSAVVTAFRAQGDINKSKKSILNELSNHLSISTERHRAEVRRVVNDDRLNDVAGCMHGPGTSTEWSIEGRRLVSLMPRLVPQTVFTAKAAAAANQAGESNQKLPIKTEIEVLPLPTKPKQLPPKTDKSADNKDDRVTNKPSTSSSDVLSKFDDKSKKKKKPNILYTKPSPLALNKTLTNPFKPSTPSSLRPMIKSSPLKYSSSYPISKPSTVLSSPMKYSPKPIILQRSPTKSQPNLSRTPSIQLQSLNSSGVNTPLSSLSTLVTSKSDNALHLIQSPMIKVVSNSLQNSINSSVASAASLQNSSITQKIKFKTPLPKPKVKATKFKPMVPLQRANLLSAAQNTDVTVVGNPGNPPSPNKSVNGPQSVSVKVVQVAKSGASSGPTLCNTNKPVVVVSSNPNKAPSQRVLAFSSVANSVSQQIRLASTSFSTTSASQTLPKGTLASKSMPLATGFKMIAVTTVVPGTTQVKTVYIATPIMSLTKTVSQTTGASITTPSFQTTKHIPNSIASNLHSVVARSMNASLMNHGKSSTLVSTTIATPSIAVGKNSKFGTSPKGLGSLKTTLSGSAQSLKLFTAVSKARTPLSVGTNVKNVPLLPSTSLLSTVVAPQSMTRVSNIHIKTVDQSIAALQQNNKSQIMTVTHHLPVSSEASNLLSISGVGQNLSVQNNNGGIINENQLQTALNLNVNNYEDVNSTLSSLLNDDSAIATERITASATADTDDMAFLNAGEKFLEQLSAKMTATSPDSLTKNESFIFPANLSIGLANEALDQTGTLFEANELDINNGISNNKSMLFQTALKAATIIPKDATYLINQKQAGAQHAIGLVSSKIGNALSNNISLVNAKFNVAASSIQSVDSLQVQQKSLSNPMLSGGNNFVVSTPAYQQRTDRTVMNYPNITKVSGKSDAHNLLNENNISPVGFINVANTLTIENSNIPNPALKLSAMNSNKLQMSMPGSSKLPGTNKLNISPALVNSNLNNNQAPQDFFTQLCTANTTLSNTIHFSTINSLQGNSVALEQLRQNFEQPSPNLLEQSNLNSINHKPMTVGITGSTVVDEFSCNNKKRKLNETSAIPGRTQASWIRGAANLLARVSRFRGTNKQKGEMNAASWFTKPVDPNDAPGYYKVIKTPMDFGKIKRKLEDGEYESYPNFFEDMMLVKNNCYSYNPDGHIARKDCDDVFSFFESEYQKLLERWEKHHVSPHKKLKISPEDVTNAS